VDQSVQGAQGVGDGGGGVRPVQLVEIDVVGPEATQAALDRLDHVAGCGPPGPSGAHRTPELGSDDHLVAVPAQRLTEPLFAVAVGVGGVKEGDTGVEGRLHDGWNLVGVHAHAEVVGPEAHHRDLDLPDVSDVHAGCSTTGTPDRSPTSRGRSVRQGASTTKSAEDSIPLVTVIFFGAEMDWSEGPLPKTSM